MLLRLAGCFAHCFRIVLELLANEASIEEIVKDHPGLERDDVLAAIAYAAPQTSHPVIPRHPGGVGFLSGPVVALVAMGA